MKTIRLWLVVSGLIEALRELGHGGHVNDCVRRVERAAGFEDSALPIVNLAPPPDLDVSTEAGRNVVLERAEEQRLPPAVRQRRVDERAAAERTRDANGIPRALRSGGPEHATDTDTLDALRRQIMAEIKAELGPEFSRALNSMRADILAELRSPAPPAPPA